MTYKEILLNAFPKTLQSDVAVVADILNNLNPHSSIHTVQLNDEFLRIPCRVYFDEPSLFMINKLTYTQKNILNCIYLRHNNGYLRQRQLEELAGVNEDWITPYILQLLGEYVLEILQVLNNIITEENIHYYKQFINDNPKYWQQTMSRVISYWQCYYRGTNIAYSDQKGFPILKDYPGQQIVDRLESK